MQAEDRDRYMENIKIYTLIPSMRIHLGESLSLLSKFPAHFQEVISHTDRLAHHSFTYFYLYILSLEKVLNDKVLPKDFRSRLLFLNFHRLGMLVFEIRKRHENLDRYLTNEYIIDYNRIENGTKSKFVGSHLFALFPAFICRNVFQVEQYKL